ncbi:MAG: winged helix-turn-helix domain-containing protein [Halocynthiibacter sp.]
MQDFTSSVSKARQSGNRVVIFGVAAIILILALAAFFLFWTLPDGNAFNARVEQIFVENSALTSDGEIKLLEILALSGTAFSETLVSYRMVIFVLLIFSAALLIAALLFLLNILALGRRMSLIEKNGIEVTSLLISRDDNTVLLNNMEFKLTPAAMEALSVLAEARLDDDILTGSEIEAMITGRSPIDCEEAAGATRIKRLRDSLGNQMVSSLLVKNIARKGYSLAITKDVIRIL